MTRFAKISAVLGFAVLAVGAQAQSVYGELGYTALDFKEPGFKASPGMVRGIVGYEISPNFAVEGLVGAGARSDTESGTKLSVGNMVGVFGKVQAPITDALKVYGRLGVVRTSLKANGVSDSDSGLAYGAGVSYDLNKAMYLNADYTSYYDRKDQKLDGFTVGVGYRF